MWPMDLISTIHLVALKKTICTINPREPLNLTYMRILFFPFLVFFGSLLESSYQKEKERVRPNLVIFWCSSFLWWQNQAEGRDHNESSITQPRTDIKNGVFVRIWI